MKSLFFRSGWAVWAV